MTNRCCFENPCIIANTKTCINLWNDAKCVCEEGYGGRGCENRIIHEEDLNEGFLTLESFSGVNRTSGDVLEEMALIEEDALNALYCEENHG